MPMPEPITLQRDAVCAQEDCGAIIRAGEQARWYTKSQKAYCVGPHKGTDTQPQDQGAYDPPFLPDEPDTRRTWGYEQKDRLMCRESCIKSAVAIFAASIAAGIYKEHPDVGAPIAYAEAFEKWCLEAL